MGFKKVIKSYTKQEKVTSLILIGILLVTLLWTAIGIVAKERKRGAIEGVYTEGIVGEINVLNPLFRDYSQITRDISKLSFSGLTKYNPKKNTFDGDLATYTIEENGTKYVFTLKEGIKWHDGEDLSVDDILFTYNAVIKNERFQNKVLQNNLSGVTVEIIADNQIQFTLSQPNSFFLSTTDTPIIPKHIFKDLPVEELSTNKEIKNLIGTGPFKIKSIDKLSGKLHQVIFERYEKYHSSQPTIKNIRFFVFENEEELFKSQNTLNAIPNLKYELTANLDKERFKTQEYFLPQYTAIFMNTQKEILSSTAVRQAINIAADKRNLNLLLPNKKIIEGPFFQTFQIEDIEESKTIEVKQILETNGWQLNDDNIYQKDDTLLQLNLAVQKFENNEQKNDENQKIVEHLQQSLELAGIQLTVNYYEKDTFTSLLQRKVHDLILTGHDLGNNYDVFSFWHSSQIGEGGGNISNFNSIATDNLIEQLRKTTDKQQKTELLEQLHEKLLTDVPAIFLYTEKHIFAFDNKIKNRTILGSYSFPSDRFYQIENWEMTK